MSVRTANAVPRTPVTSQTCVERSDRIKQRRGLTFLAMTLVLPGVAQLAAGHRLGRVALRVWATLWFLALLAALLTLILPELRWPS